MWKSIGWLGWLASAAVAMTVRGGAAHECEAETRRVPSRFATTLFDRSDENGDGKITRAESRRASLRLFAQLDESGDGVVTWHEARKGALGWRRRRFEARFVELDRDGNGFVDPRELALPAHRFSALDRDGDGSLSRGELAARLLRRPNARARIDRARAQFRHADGDSDGRVTREEMLLDAGRRFARRDQNRDGYLTRGEARRSRRRR